MSLMFFFFFYGIGFAHVHCKQVPDERYYPPVEVFKGCCRQVKKGYPRTNSQRYYLSYIDRDGRENQSATVEPHLVAQMDTESPVLYQKTCLDYNFEKPVKVSDASYTVYVLFISQCLCLINFRIRWCNIRKSKETNVFTKLGKNF